MEQNLVKKKVGEMNQAMVDAMAERHPVYLIGDTMAMLGLMITMDLWLKIWR